MCTQSILVFWLHKPEYKKHKLGDTYCAFPRDASMNDTCSYVFPGEAGMYWWILSML